MSDSATESRARTVLILLAGLLAAAVGNLLISAVARAAGASDDFRQLDPATFLPLTVIGFLAGAIGWSVIRARAADPATVLRRAVPVVLVLSFLPDAGLLLAGDVPGVSAGGVAALVLMHLMVAVCALPAYARALPVAGRREVPRPA